MSDDVLQRFKQLRAPSEAADDPEEERGCFGYLRGLRERATMLELRLRTGNAVAFGYAWLEQAEYDPSDGITLTFLGRKVRLLGGRLNRDGPAALGLFDGLLRHRVVWVREAERNGAAFGDAAEPLVREIRIE